MRGTDEITVRGCCTGGGGVGERATCWAGATGVTWVCACRVGGAVLVRPSRRGSHAERENQPQTHLKPRASTFLLTMQLPQRCQRELAYDEGTQGKALA